VKESISTTDIILGKSDESLEQHTKKTIQSLKAILDIYPNVHGIAEYDTLKEDLIISAILHDHGKATVGWQRYAKTGEIWGFRHELLSAAIAYDFLNIDKKRGEMICVTIATHHKSLNVLREYTDISYEKIEGWDGYVQELQPYWSRVKKIIDKLCREEGIHSLHLPKELISLKDPYTILKKFDDNPFKENSLRKEGFFYEGIFNCC